MTGWLTRLSERFRNGYRMGALKIIGGTAGGQVISLMAAPILSRLYTPADFGVFIVLSSCVFVLATVCALRFELAIPLPKADRDAYGLVALGLWSILVTTILTVGCVCLFGYRWTEMFGAPELMPWLFCAPPIAAIIGVFTILNQLAIRQQRYGAIGRRNLLQQLATVLAQLLTGFASFGVGGLILGFGLGQGLGALSLTWGSGLRNADAREGHRPRTLRRVASRYRRFPLLLAPSGLLNVLGLQLPVVLIALWYGVEVAGWLGLTQRVLAIPMTLLGISIAQVYLGALSQAARSEGRPTRYLFKVASLRLAIAGLSCALPVLMFGPLIFAAIFGTSWIESGQYARALALSLAAQLLAAPLSQTLIVFERQFTQLAWDAGRLLATSAAVIACGLGGLPAIASVWALSMTSTACYTASWWLSKRVAFQVESEETRRK